MALIIDLEPETKKKIFSVLNFKVNKEMLLKNKKERQPNTHTHTYTHTHTHTNLYNSHLSHYFLLVTYILSQ